MSVISIALTVYDLREVSFPINPMISERRQLRLYQNFIKEENQEIVISPSTISDSKIFCTTAEAHSTSVSTIPLLILD